MSEFDSAYEQALEIARQSVLVRRLGQVNCSATWYHRPEYLPCTWCGAAI